MAITAHEGRRTVHNEGAQSARGGDGVRWAVARRGTGCRERRTRRSGREWTHEFHEIDDEHVQCPGVHVKCATGGFPGFLFVSFYLLQWLSFTTFIPAGRRSRFVSFL
jgi:hypothetical protein